MPGSCWTAAGCGDSGVHFDQHLKNKKGRSPDVVDVTVVFVVTVTVLPCSLI